eukprot:13305127-Alexandrium_andersonii.AAC.1
MFDEGAWPVIRPGPPWLACPAGPGTSDGRSGACRRNEGWARRPWSTAKRAPADRSVPFGLDPFSAEVGLVVGREL